jgi:hypothetical protein
MTKSNCHCERGPAHERSECIGCSEAISLARGRLPGDCRVASLLLMNLNLQLYSDLSPRSGVSFSQ